MRLDRIHLAVFQNVRNNNNNNKSKHNCVFYSNATRIGLDNDHNQAKYIVIRKEVKLAKPKT